MTKKRIIKAVLYLLAAVAACILGTKRAPATAASAVDVQLTAAQTRALYGDTISGSYYNGNDFVPVSFSYYGTASYNSKYVTQAVNSPTIPTTSYQSFQYLLYAADINADINATVATAYTAELQPILNLSNLYTLQFVSGFSHRNSGDYVQVGNNNTYDILNKTALSYYIGDTLSSVLPVYRIYNYNVRYFDLELQATPAGTETTFPLTCSYYEVNETADIAFSFSFSSIRQSGGVSSPNGDDTENSYNRQVYLVISTPIVSAEYHDDGSGGTGGGDSSGGDTPDYSAQLNQIISLLQQIATQNGYDDDTPEPPELTTSPADDWSTPLFTMPDFDLDSAIDNAGAAFDSPYDVATGLPALSPDSDDFPVSAVVSGTVVTVPDVDTSEISTTMGGFWYLLALFVARLPVVAYMITANIALALAAFFLYRGHRQ